MTDDRMTVHAGDCLDVIRTLADNSIDSVVTDPPYALQSVSRNNSRRTNIDAPGFMGKQWDTGDVAFSVELWAEVLRVLKPGGHVLAFGGSRTYHRLACAVEDAGFEIRDQIMWVFGSGFPKSHDVSKGIDKAAGAEREVRGIAEHASKRPLGRENTYKDRTEYRLGSAADITAPATDAARQWEGWGTALKPAHEPIVLARKPLSEATVAANVLRWGTGAINVDGCRVKFFTVGEPAVIDKQPHAIGRWPANLIHDGSDEVLAAFRADEGYSDSGSAARFFKQVEPDSKQIQCVSRRCYSPTACALFGYCRVLNFNEGARLFYQAKASKKDRMGSKHPTVKPIKLMQYLVRLITPPGGTVLDCFAGTGTTGQAAITEGFRAILIEREEEYLADIDRRFAPTEKSVSAERGTGL